MRTAALAAATIVVVGIYLSVAAVLAFSPALIVAGTAVVASMGAIVAVAVNAGRSSARFG